ncbi:ABC transporter permease [Cerasicoccus fimbriatus]|uniref:ABC transporter permease n=1 Tax=Cerasicoccus fimbriatus TaxID=3014554 RepID=UPI0022B58ED8|nr:ABC transporter permease [Cerasicoccus sp. TK19100]
MPWYLYLAFKQLFPTGRAASFFAWISITGVALGVAILIVFASIMNGLGERIRGKVSETFGHAHVFTGSIIYDYEELLDDLRAYPGVKAATPYTNGMLMMQFGNRPAFPKITGLNPWEEDQVVPLEDYILQGSIDKFNDQKIIISMGIARQLQVGVGDLVNLYSPLMLQQLKRDEIPLPMELEVCAIFESGFNEVDNNTIVVTRRTMQELYGLGDGIHGVMLLIDDPDSVHDFTHKLQQHLGGDYQSLSWMEANENLLFLLQFEKTIMLFLLFVILIIAGFCISAILIVTALQKTREIGLLHAMGGRSRQLAAIFCLDGMLVSMMGCIVGTVMAFLLINVRSFIIKLMLYTTGQSDAFQEHYPLPIMDLPIAYQISDFVLIYIFCLLVGALAGLYPAWRAANMNPSEAIRAE